MQNEAKRHFLDPDSPDGKSKQKGITTRLIGAELNCLSIPRKVFIDVEFVAIKENEISTPYFFNRLLRESADGFQFKLANSEHSEKSCWGIM